MINDYQNVQPYNYSNQINEEQIKYIWTNIINLLPKIDVIHLIKQPNKIDNYENKFYKFFSYKYMMPALYSNLSSDAGQEGLHRYAVLAVAAWRYWQFVVNVPGTEHTNRYMEMVDRLDKSLPF